MDDMQRTDMLAQMGLTAIMRAYDAHPQKVRLVPEDILIKIKAYDITTDQGGESEQSKNDRTHMARALLHTMLDEGIFHGQGSLGGLSSVSLSPQIRMQLRARNSREESRSDEMRNALKRADEGQLPSQGAFTEFARKIGFEP